MAKANYREMCGPHGHLANRVEFEGNSMSARWMEYRPFAGLLSSAEIDRLDLDWAEAKATGERLYVVFSYATPVAWARAGEPAHIVDQKFSVTTSKGQGYVRAWINHNYPACDTVSQTPGWDAYASEKARIFGGAK